MLDLTQKNTVSTQAITQVQSVLFMLNLTLTVHSVTQAITQVQLVEQDRYLPCFTSAFFSVVQLNNSVTRKACTYSSLLLTVVVQL
jgi:hypothetical protein